MIERKVIRLQEYLKDMKRVMVAYSGGLDSTYLLAMSVQALGAGNVCAATSKGPALPEQDRTDAEYYADKLGVKHFFLDAGEINDERYTENTEKRCYWCKHNLFKTMSATARELGVVMADGFNSSDRNDWRPGKFASNEWGVRHPLDENEFTKEDIRTGAWQIGLPCWNKPDSPCLASRIPYGKAVTIEALREVDKIEKSIRAFNFHVVRARHLGPAIRIEVGHDELYKLNNQRLKASIVEAIRNCMGNGFDKEIMFDPEGYRRGKTRGLTEN